MSRLSTLTHVNKANSSSAARLRSTATVVLTPHHRRPADMCGAWRRELCGGGAHPHAETSHATGPALRVPRQRPRPPTSVAMPAPPLPASPIRTSSGRLRWRLSGGGAHSGLVERTLITMQLWSGSGGSRRPLKTCKSQQQHGQQRRSHAGAPPCLQTNAELQRAPASTGHAGCV